jgi:N-acyl-D-aspartate/D-glutamate deacylase
MHDILIRGATLVDGLGGPPQVGDLAVADGRIVAVGGRIDGSARETIDAGGALLTPAWVDIHTHYDGQVTWDGAMDPSASHGVGTVVMGNCGVGFAPVAPGDENALIELMEGVEDIPGTALHEGMPWGRWQSYPDYLDLLAGREYALDVGSLMAHGPVRHHVMGERGRRNLPATDDDIRAMARLVAEGARAGALGFSTSRIAGHRAIDGAAVPGTFAEDAEVLALGRALGAAGHGVFQMIPASTLGSAPQFGGERHALMAEVELMARISRESGRPLTFTLMQVDEFPDQWREVLARVGALNREGAQLHPQVGARPTGIVMSLDTYHPFMRRPGCLALRDLPVARRAAVMRQPAVRAAILAETSVPHAQPGRMENVVAFARANYPQTWALADVEAAEPLPERSFAARAAAAGQDEESFLYDWLTAGEGRDFVVRFFTNYSGHSHEALREMQLSDLTVSGLSDAGAHVSVIFDAVAPTFQLTHWVRDRHRGPRLPLAHVVHRQTWRNARLFGLADRGALRPGLRADLNLIDFERLALGPLALHRDLPADGARLLQPARGYVGTWVNGVRTRRDDRDTGARPGRLVRGARAGAGA